MRVTRVFRIVAALAQMELVKAVGMAYAAYRTIVETATDGEDAKSVATDLATGGEPIRDAHACEQSGPNVARVVEAERNEDTATATTQTDHGDVLADFAEPFFVDEMVDGKSTTTSIPETPPRSL
ncbi:hypothetical protein [Rhodococcus erythropolis]|uniref:hypothetical protein n=1 Tax=Rhodococcus erythropolis TaxID=1833 RepID=UPI001BE636E2|nr:hypothetical protein [Rhodococcus erythropolis]MBT2263515.1 hypothetical protein [Rhodococcus erythropolis]